MKRYENLRSLLSSPASAKEKNKQTKKAGGWLPIIPLAAQEGSPVFPCFSSLPIPFSFSSYFIGLPPEAVNSKRTDLLGEGAAVIVVEFTSRASRQ